jgi:Dna[CI] antecedent, DciA
MGASPLGAPRAGAATRGSSLLSALLEQALDQHGLSLKLDRRLPAQIWEAAVGREIALRARPTVLSAGTLHILVVDHRWRDQLDAMRSMVIARLNARLGRPLVRELRFGLAHEGALESPEAGRSGGSGTPLRLRPTTQDPDGGSSPAGAPSSRPAEDALLPAAAKLPAELREALLRAACAQRARLEQA